MILRRLLRTGLRRGLLGGSRAWLYAGLAAGAASLIRRAVVVRPELLARETLEPGEGLTVRVLQPEEG